MPEIESRIRRIISQQKENSANVSVTGESRREQRELNRQKSFQKATVDTLSGEYRDCIVSDYSDTGCCIRLDGANNLPAVVKIIIPSIGVKRLAERCWFGDRDAGYRFYER